MIPAGLGAALGVDLPTLLSVAPGAAQLISALEIARGTGSPQAAFFRFVNSAIKANPGMTRAQAAESYRVAKAWTAVPGLLQKYSSDTPFDPNLARPGSKYGAYAGEYGGFITEAKVTVTDPATGQSRTYGFKVADNVTWSFNDINDYVIGQLEDVVGASPTIGGARSLHGLGVQVEITDFIRIV